MSAAPARSAGADSWGRSLARLLGQMQAVRARVASIARTRARGCSSPDPAMFREHPWPRCQHRWHIRP